MSQLMFRSFLIPAIALGMCTGAASAQAGDVSDQSPEEILDLFQQQTRGLVLSPSSGAGSASNTQSTAAQTSVETAEIADVPRDQQVFVNISFDFDSAVLKEDQKPRLTNLCIAIKSSDISLFKIVGHTDSAGSEAYNEKLSLLRAEEVKRFMINECGIAAERLLAVGVGERYPYNKADPRSDENRRVEFQVVS